MKLLILLVFLIAVLTFFALGYNKLLTFQTLKTNRDVLIHYTESHYWPMMTATVVVYTASTAFSLPVAVVLSLATGFLFGRWVGTAIIIFSATTGATLVLLAARFVFADAARRRMGPRSQRIIAGFQKNDFSYLLFLRLVALFPFWLVNLVTAFTPIKVRTYILATAIGITPGSFVFANLGQSLGRIDSTDQLLSGRTLGALLLLGLLALIPVLLKRFKLIKTDGDS